MKPLFVPGTKGKAHYSDTNFQLLGLIIESLTGKTIAQALHDVIFEPLQLKNTYLYTDSTDKKPTTIYYKNQPLQIEKAMTSFGADGGIVSTVIFSRKKYCPINMSGTTFCFHCNTEPVLCD